MPQSCDPKRPGRPAAAFRTIARLVGDAVREFNFVGRKNETRRLWINPTRRGSVLKVDANRMLRPVGNDAHVGAQTLLHLISATNYRIDLKFDVRLP